MKQHSSALTKDKNEILEEIKKIYRIKPVTAVIVLILTVFIFFLIIGAINNIGKNITSDFISALINFFFVWNLGFGLYKGAWQYWNSRKINKVLFPKLDQSINESKEKSYDETETEVYEKVKVAYTDYTEKYNKLSKIYWSSLKISFAFPLIAIIIWFIYHQL